MTIPPGAEVRMKGTMKETEDAIVAGLGDAQRKVSEHMRMAWCPVFPPKVGDLEESAKTSLPVAYH